MSTLSVLPYELFDTHEVDRRFWRITKNVFIVFVVLSLIVPVLPVFELSREKKAEVPARVAKVLLKKKEQRQQKKNLPQPEAKKTLPAKKSVPKKKVKKKPKPTPTVKERVAKVGLLAFRDDLAALRETPQLKRLSNPNRRLSNAGSASAFKASKPVTRNVKSGSGGLGGKNLKRETLKTTLRENKLSKVDSKIAALADQDKKGDARGLVRTIEEIRLALERHKGSFNILYTKQLRRNPSIKGKVLFELVIAPSGQVVSCRVVESELSSPALERKFVLKFRSIDFGEKDVETTIINYPLDFFPS